MFCTDYLKKICVFQGGPETPEKSRKLFSHDSHDVNDPKIFENAKPEKNITKANISSPGSNKKKTKKSDNLPEVVLMSQKVIDKESLDQSYSPTTGKKTNTDDKFNTRSTASHLDDVPVKPERGQKLSVCSVTDFDDLSLTSLQDAANDDTDQLASLPSSPVLRNVSASANPMFSTNLFQIYLHFFCNTGGFVRDCESKLTKIIVANHILYSHVFQPDIA